MKVGAGLVYAKTAFIAIEAEARPHLESGTEFVIQNGQSFPKIERWWLEVSRLPMRSLFTPAPAHGQPLDLPTNPTSVLHIETIQPSTSNYVIVM